MNNKFSENLKKIRKDKNMSQEQLADELGVSRQAISKWESAIAYPEMDKIIAICDKFNLNIDDLLHRDIKEVKGEEESKKKINFFIDDILKFITNTIDLFGNMNFKTKVKCIFEQCITAGVLFVLALFIYLIFGDLLGNIIRFLPDKVYYYVINFLDSIIIVVLLIISIVFMINIFKTRYLDYYETIKSDNEVNNDDLNKNYLKDSIDKKNKIIIRDPKHSEYRFLNFLLKLIVGFIKFFSLIFSIVLVMVLIGLFISFIISFLLYKTGLFFIGLLLTILSSSIITIVLLLLIFNFVFNRINDKKNMIWSFLVSIIVFGIGCGLIAVGFISFDVMGDDKSQVKIVTKEYDMKDDLLLFPNDNYNVKYVVSENKNIKIDYYVNKNFTIEESSSSLDDNSIIIWTNCNNPFKLVRNYIKNVNNKKIYFINDRVYKVTVYTNKSNIDKLKENLENHLKIVEQENDLRNSYEKSISELEKENDELRQKVNELEDELNNK